jgi:hypothetical protein
MNIFFNRFKQIQSKQVIYKILSEHQWTKLKSEGIFNGTDMDLASGYIHMSKTPKQVERIINKYYKKTGKIYILHICSDQLEKLIDEPISNGDIYAHLYQPLSLDYVIETTELIV